MRKLLIAGNWKMNAGPTEAKVLADEMAEVWKNKEFNHEALICPPYVSLPFVVKSFRDSFFKTGAQNVYTEDNGAFTGEISTSMLKELTCDYVILGHSERREYFQESDEFIASKVVKSLSDSIRPILCVGEKLEERKANEQKTVVEKQLKAVLSQVDEKHAEDFVVAYEPVWAIGTGETASPEQAQEMHAFIRSLIADNWSPEAADKVRILYGGSMKPANAEELLSQKDVDGGLIGGASLKADSFSEIMTIAEQTSK
ncbi:triose-phosphate isomerase [Rhodohalobacter sp.]|uniref:triose-phosphate isomerase n=1 Tax=Rhodohalobacter sp. TaxID=1974210 RepID=UPI002ACD9A6E|nr:triose-phosphate isomerase [Rhodohalobacter sp.]MDZ7757326.1 triose-phosphate isomerase [Rhodohalobacter sp.]